MDQATRPLVSLGIAVLVASIAAGASGFSDEAENFKRLQGMPRERRVDLSEKLETFDRLEPAEQAAIRKLDAALARKNPIDQAKYRAILRRYHLWVNGLSDAQKKELEQAADPDARFNLARKFRLAQGDDAKARGARVSGIRSGDYGLDGPGDVAFLLQIWKQLTTAEQAEISKRTGRELLTQIRTHHLATGVKRDAALLREEAAFLGRLEADTDFRTFLSPIIKNMTEAAQRKAEASPKKGEAATKKAENPTRKAEHTYVEFLYFEEMPVPQVSSKNLDRFLATCPPWLMGMLDPLAPEDARSYLTIVYRQLYPHPAEMPEPARDKDKPGGKPAARKVPGGPNPS